MSAPYRAVTLDESEPLLAMSYRLRYQTFCLERLFFSKDKYPSQLEFDAFDRTAVHVGVLNAETELVGTARVVTPNSAGLPLFRYCTLFPDDTTFADPSNVVVELSRVCLNRRANRRTRPGAAAPPDATLPADPPPSSLAHSLASSDPLATLIKGMYHVTKRVQATHWIIAIEKALRRRITRYGLPFRQAGPEVDYHGPVAPYVMNLAEFDEVIGSGDYPILEDFWAELEPEYAPQAMSPTSA